MEDDNVFAMNALSYCMTHFKQYDEAYSLLKKAHELEPQDYETNFNLGVYHLDRTNQLDESLRFFDVASQMAEDESQKAKCLFNIAKAHEEKDDLQSAITTYEQAMQYQENDHKTLVNLAILKDKIGERERAIQLLEKAIVIKGTGGRKIHTNLGIIKRKEGNYQESQLHIEKALEISDQKQKQKNKDLIYIHKLAVATDSKQSEAELKKCLSEAFQSIKENKKSKFRVQLATICDELGEKSMAEELFKLEHEATIAKDKILEDGINQFQKQLTEKKQIKNIQKFKTQSGLNRMSTKRTEIFEDENDDEEGKEQDNQLKKNKTQTLLKKTNNFSIHRPVENTEKPKSRRTFKQSSQSRSIIQEEEEGDDEDASRDQKTSNKNDCFEEDDEDGLETDEDMQDNQGADQQDNNITISERHDSGLLNAVDEDKNLNVSREETPIILIQQKNDDSPRDMRIQDEAFADLKHEEDDKEYLLIDNQIKQVILFKEDSPHSITSSRLKVKQKESSSSVRYSQNDEEEEDRNSNSEHQDHKFFAVQINSPAEENNEKIVEHYQIPSIKNTSEINESNVTEQRVSPEKDKAQDELINRALNLQFNQPEKKKSPSDDEIDSQECESWSPRTCQYKISQKPDNHLALFRLAQILFDEKKYLNAAELFSKSLQVKPEYRSLDSLNYLIKCYEKLSKFEKCIELFNEIIEIYNQKYREQQQQVVVENLFEYIFQKGKCFEMMKNFKQAILTYTQCTTLNVKHSKLYMRLASCQKKLKNYDKAAENLEQAILIEEVSERDIEKQYLKEHMLNLAIILFQKLGKYEKARYYANRVLEKDPHNPSAFVILGLVNEKLEEYDDAIKYLKLSSRIDQHALESYYRLGKINDKLGKKKQAITCFKNCLIIDQAHFDSLKALATLLMNMEEYERAIKYFKHALQVNEDNIEVLYGYSFCLYRNYLKFKQRLDLNSMQPKDREVLKVKRIELTTAMKYLKLIRTIAPSYFQALKLMGEIYMREKKYDRAVQCLKEALNLNKNDSQVIVMIGNILYEHDNHGIALSYYKKALALNPKEFRALICLGNAKYDKGNYEEAVIYYVKAIEVDPKQADVHYDLANAYFNINQVDKAIYHYREAIRLNSNRVEYFFNLGNALSLQEKYEEAIAQYQLAIDIDPDHAALAYFNKGNSHYFLGEFSRAIDSYNKAIFLDDRNADIHFNLGNAYQETRDFQNAIYHYKMVIRLDGKQEEAYINLANIFQVHLNEKERAYKLYGKILKIFPNNEKAKKELSKISKKLSQGIMV